MGGAVLAEVPALPLHTAGKYVAGAYVVLFVLVLIYVVIMAIRLSRMEGQLGELLTMAERAGERARVPAERARVPAERDRRGGAEAAEQLEGPRESTLAYPVKGHPPFRGAGE
jgi:hypothetical protein